MVKHKRIKCHVKKITSSKSEDNNSIAMSAELLRSTLSVSFFSISILCFIFSVVGLLYNLIIQYWLSVISIIAIINFVIVIFQFLLTILYFHGFQKKILIITRSILQIISLFIVFVGFVLLVLNVFKDYQTIYSIFAITNMGVLLFTFFFSLYKEISNERNKDYIVNYFSALTAFVALIVSFVALIKQ